MVERMVRIHEVRGSIPLISIDKRDTVLVSLYLFHMGFKMLSR